MGGASTYAFSKGWRLAVVAESWEECIAESFEQFIVDFTELNEKQRGDDRRKFPFGFAALPQTGDQLFGTVLQPRNVHQG